MLSIGRVVDADMETVREARFKDSARCRNRGVENTIY